MYSLVLMAALSAQGEVPQGLLNRRGGCAGMEAASAGCAGRGGFFRVRERRREGRGGCGGVSRGYGCNGSAGVGVYVVPSSTQVIVSPRASQAVSKVKVMPAPVAKAQEYPKSYVECVNGICQPVKKAPYSNQHSAWPPENAIVIWQRR